MCIRDRYANVHRGLHYLANEATEAYEGARETVRAFLNAGRPEEIIFTRNATEAINLVAYTFGRERIKPGDEICLLYTSDAADDLTRVDLGGRRIIKKK